MRATGFAMLLTLASTCLAAGEPAPAIYHPDPKHLWNRLYEQLAVRTLAGVQYGTDIAEAYPDEFDNRERLIATLDEFLATAPPQQLPSGFPRALLLNDVWTGFDVAAALPRENDVLRARLAQALDRLLMNAAQIAELEDNYAAAVRTRRFAQDFDPQHPEVAFLPADLFDPRGPWVQIGGGGRGLVAPLHTQLVSGRSAFFVFIRCPGGRQQTLAYLSRLNLHPTPWLPNPEPFGTSYPGNEKVRLNVLRADPNTPQLPHGTIVALVRRMMLIDDRLNLILSPLTQKVQLRVYDGAGESAKAAARVQHVYEFVMRRQDLIANVTGGLHAVAADDREYQGLLVPAERKTAEYFGGYAVLKTCTRCHSGDGVMSVRSYVGGPGVFPANPQLKPVYNLNDQVDATASWKQLQFNWGLLHGFLEKSDR